MLKAFENGDIPQNISKNIVKGLTTYKDIPSAYFFVAGGKTHTNNYVLPPVRPQTVHEAVRWSGRGTRTGSAFWIVSPGP